MVADILVAVLGLGEAGGHVCGGGMATVSLGRGEQRRSQHGGEEGEGVGEGEGGAGQQGPAWGRRRLAGAARMAGVGAKVLRRRRWLGVEGLLPSI